jgi:beta-lactamase regulating signal transducer with metallopeptidase domain
VTFPSMVPAGYLGWVLAWLGTWLVHGTLLMGGAWAASLAARSPGVRDALWKTAVAGAFVTATLSVAAARARTPAAEPSVRRLVMEPGPPSTPLRGRLRIRTAAPGAGASSSAGLPPRAAGAVLAVWLLGAMVAGARLERGRRRYWRAAGPRHAAGDADAAAALQRLREGAGIGRTVYLTCAHGLAAPAAVGAAEICLPAAVLAALTPAQRESVLAHELGHLARRDPLWKVAVEIAAALLWFQPLLRVARAQMADCAELLADGFAVRVTGRRRPLVESLGILAAALPHHGAAAAGFGDGGSPLIRRVARLMDASRAPAGPLPALARTSLAVAALAATLAFFPAVRPPAGTAPRVALRSLLVEGAELNAARTGVASVQPGGRVRLADERVGVRRELDVTRGADGRPAYAYRENGASHPFDDRARSWLAGALSGR